jgi:hypothetical protein
MAVTGVQGASQFLADRDLIVFHPVAMEALLQSREGPVGKDLLRRCVRVESAAKRLLSQPGRGRVRNLTNPKRTHQASAPGDPPAVDLGHLRASVDHAIGRGIDGDLFGIVGTSLKKGFWLEVGTRKIAARPWLRPSLRAAGDV